MTTNDQPKASNQLIDDYRAIQAPLGFADRLQVQIDGRQSINHWWLPVVGAAITATVVLLIILIAEPGQQTKKILPLATNFPTLGTLPNIGLQQPIKVSLSLANVRGVSIPTLPPINTTAKKSQPQQKQAKPYHEADNNRQLEYDNVYS